MKKCHLPVLFVIFSMILCCMPADMHAAVKPTVNQVVKQFFSKYKFDENALYQLKFAKNEAGWTVYQLDPDNNFKPYKKALFWSKEKGAYQKVDYETADSFDKVMYDRYMVVIEGDMYGYRRCIYYGYNGWDRDIIDSFENVKSPGDTILESLARAYGNYAQTQLWSQYGYRADDVYLKDYKFGDEISDKRINLFLRYAAKDLRTYKKLQGQNPAYQTLVGNVALKYGLECMWVSSVLELCHRRSLALQYVSDSLFSDYYLCIGKNCLKAAAPNSIFVADGDFDTYVLWYLQIKKHYRTDVTVLNFSLLNLPLYVNAIQKGFLGAQAVHTSFDSAALSQSKDYYLLEYGDKPVPVKELIHDMITKEPNQHWYRQIYSANMDWYFSIFGRAFELPVDYRAFKNDGSAKYKLKPAKRMTVDGGGGSYMYSNQLFMLDILSTNNWVRPVYFSNMSSDWTDNNSLNVFVASEPFVQHLTAYKDEGTKPAYSRVNADTVYDIMMHRLEWESSPGAAAKDEKVMGFNNNFYSCYLKMADLVFTRDSVKAGEIIKEVLKKAPVEDNLAGSALFAIAYNYHRYGLDTNMEKRLVDAGLASVTISLKYGLSQNLGESWADYYQSEFHKLKDFCDAENLKEESARTSALLELLGYKENTGKK